jgi:hypothetical protein
MRTMKDFQPFLQVISPRTNRRLSPTPKHVINEPELTFAGRAQRIKRPTHTLMYYSGDKTALLKGVVL